MQRLKELRRERGWSQARLAGRAELDPSTVNQIERGVREASPGTLRKLAEALEVSLYELLEDDSPKAQAPRSVKEQLRDDPGAAVDLMESWASEGENTGIGPGSLFSTLFKLDVEIQRAEAEDRPGVIDDLAAEQRSETILRWLHIRRGWVEDGHYEPIHPMTAQAAARSLERLLKA
jgi:transcriptional regulator with XRE-family HTH domain